MAGEVAVNSFLLALAVTAYKTAVLTSYAPVSWAVASLCAWLAAATVTGWRRMSAWEQRHLLWGLASLLAFLHFLLLDPTFQSWSDVFYFCGTRMEYCNCNFRWNSRGWTKAAVLWNFTLSSALALQKLVIGLGLNGLLPGEDLVTKESFISIGWRLVPYWLNNWEQQWGAECSSMIFELPHFALELLVVLPCAQIIAARLKILGQPHVRLPAGLRQRRVALAGAAPAAAAAAAAGADAAVAADAVHAPPPDDGVLYGLPAAVQPGGGHHHAEQGQHAQQARQEQGRQAEDEEDEDGDLVPDPLRCVWVHDPAQRRLLPRLRANVKMMGVLVLITSVAFFNAMVMPLALEGQVRNTPRSDQILRLSDELAVVAGKGRLAEMARWYEGFIEADLRRASAGTVAPASAGGNDSTDGTTTALEHIRSRVGLSSFQSGSGSSADWGAGVQGGSGGSFSVDSLGEAETASAAAVDAGPESIPAGAVQYGSDLAAQGTEAAGGGVVSSVGHPGDTWVAERFLAEGWAPGSADGNQTESLAAEPAEPASQDMQAVPRERSHPTAGRDGSRSSSKGSEGGWPGGGDQQPAPLADAAQQAARGAGSRAASSERRMMLVVAPAVLGPLVSWATNTEGVFAAIAANPRMEQLPPTATAGGREQGAVGAAALADANMGSGHGSDSSSTTVSDSSSRVQGEEQGAPSATGQEPAGQLGAAGLVSGLSGAEDHQQGQQQQQQWDQQPQQEKPAEDGSSQGYPAPSPSTLAVSLLAMKVAGGAPWPSADNITQVTAELGGPDVGAAARAVDARLAVLCTLWEPMVPMHWLRALHLPAAANSTGKPVANATLLWAFQFRRRPNSDALVSLAHKAWSAKQDLQLFQEWTTRFGAGSRPARVTQDMVEQHRQLVAALVQLGEQLEALAPEYFEAGRGAGGKTLHNTSASMGSSSGAQGAAGGGGDQDLTDNSSSSSSSSSGGSNSVGWSRSGRGSSSSNSSGSGSSGEAAGPSSEASLAAGDEDGQGRGLEIGADDRQQDEEQDEQQGGRGQQQAQQQQGGQLSQQQNEVRRVSGFTLARVLLGAMEVADLHGADGIHLGHEWLAMEEAAASGGNSRAPDVGWLRGRQRQWEDKGCRRDPLMAPLYKMLNKHAAELRRMRDPEHRSLIPLVETSLAVMRLSCESFFSLAAVFAGYLLFRDPPPGVQWLIVGVARLSHVFQRAILYAFPAVCWSYGAGFVFSSFVSVVFWTGPLLRTLERMRTAATTVMPRAWHPAKPEELERMGGQCAICWGDMGPDDGQQAAAAAGGGAELAGVTSGHAEQPGRSTAPAAVTLQGAPSGGGDLRGGSMQQAEQQAQHAQEASGAAGGEALAAPAAPGLSGPQPGTAAAAAAGGGPVRATPGGAVEGPTEGGAAASSGGEPGSGSRAMGLPCGHAYHEECLLQWLHQCYGQARQPTCPMCQASIRLRVTYRLPFTTPSAAAAGQDGNGDAGGAVAQAAREPGIQGLRELVAALQDDFRNRFEPVFMGPDMDEFIARANEELRAAEPGVRAHVEQQHDLARRLEQDMQLLEPPRQPPEQEPGGRAQQAEQLRRQQQRAAHAQVHDVQHTPLVFHPGGAPPPPPDSFPSGRHGGHGRDPCGGAAAVPAAGVAGRGPEQDQSAGPSSAAQQHQQQQLQQSGSEGVSLAEPNSAPAAEAGAAVGVHMPPRGALATGGDRQQQEGREGGERRPERPPGWLRRLLIRRRAPG